MNNGFYMVVTPNRFNELEKVIKSLRRVQLEPIMVMVAKDRYQAHEFKTLCGLLSPFKNTVMMDIDMFVLQKFGEVFDIVSEGKIALYEEKKWGIYNSGFVAFEKNLMREVSKVWHDRYIHKNFKDRKKWKGLWEQDILTNILRMRDKIRISKHQIYNLEKWYNYCIYKFKPEEELKDWDQIKILHYWYRSGNKPDPKRRSWRVWLGEEIMVKGNTTLVDEIRRLRGTLAFKPRLNARRIGMLDHLLSFAGVEVGAESKAIGEVKGKSFEELEKEKKAGEKPKKEEVKKAVAKKKEVKKEVKKEEKPEYQYIDK